MAVTLNASASAGLITTADTSTILQLQTGGTTALAVSAAQVVTLTNPLPVASGGSGGTTSTGTGANVLGTTPSFTSTIGVGGATASASGTGITFPATQSASTNANTLDDYEEGTWTPALTCDTGSVSGYTSQVGYYRKIGSQVTVWFGVAASTISGILVRLSGLPFSVNSTGTGYIPLTRNSASTIALEVFTGTSGQAFYDTTAAGYLTGANAQGKTLGGVYTYIAS